MIILFRKLILRTKVILFKMYFSLSNIFHVPLCNGLSLPQPFLLKRAIPQAEVFHQGDKGLNINFHIGDPCH